MKNRIKNLVIVESPSKSKTIKKYLGKDFEVTSSQGHIRDLSKKDLSVDIKNNFTPKYIIPQDKKKIVSELKSLSQNTEMIYLASDDDREGEAIAWHLKTALELTDEKIKRIVFHEITEKAIKNAISNPRNIDINLVNSQQARRILDRLVGYILSPLLWKKIGCPGLSAGRVQSVAVKMIVERENEIKKFNSEKYFKIIADFKTKDNIHFSAEMKKNTISEEETKTVLGVLSKSEFFIKDIEKKEVKESPMEPFTTSTLQQEASIKFSFSITQTMLIAQRLYEKGIISYMRTDSVILSEDATEQAQNVIKREYGEIYIQRRKFKSKIKNAQEAHEAIRPTNFENINVSDDINEQKLYMLIRSRALASQMADAIIDRTILTISSNTNYVFSCKCEFVKFDGFLKLYQKEKEDDNKDEDNMHNSIITADIKKNDNVYLLQTTAEEKYSSGPSRFSEASLVKKLEKEGIGRPSTYAPTIATIIKKGYVVKESREGEKRTIKIFTLKNDNIEEKSIIKTMGSEKNKLYPTDIAFVIDKFLENNFPDIINYKFTAKVEEELDNIANAKENWIDMLHNFYEKFITKVDKCYSNIEKVDVKNKKLGIDPRTGKNVYISIGRFGHFIQLGDNSENVKPKRISLSSYKNVDKITLQEALKLIYLPKEIGEYKGNKVIINIGKFGPYINCGEINVSIYDKTKIFDISIDDAIELINKKIEYEKNKKNIKKK